MNPTDIMHYSFSLMAIVITFCFIFTTYYIVKTLKSVARMTSNIEDTTDSIRQTLHLKILSSVPTILSSFIGAFIKGNRKSK
jgi:hypothetical protein